MQIVMPKLGLTMTEATLTRWRKVTGESVEAGEILFEFESDKSVMEYEAPAAGVLAEIIVQEGETVSCGTPVAVLQGSEDAEVQGSEGAEVQGSRGAGERGSKVGVQEQSSNLPTFRLTNLSPLATPAAKRLARELGVDLSTIYGRGPEGRIQLVDVERAAQAALAAVPAMTPVAKRAAAELGVDLARLSGSGPGGRIVKEDVLQAAASRPEPAPAVSGGAVPSRVVSLSGVRNIIARRMSESAFSAPHVTLFSEADATALVEARRQINAELAAAAGQMQNAAAPTKISYNALLVAIVARLLPEYPALNAGVIDEVIHVYQEVNIALAVDTERGLLVPVIRQADRLDLVTIQRSGDELIRRALDGKSMPDDLTGGTFTITNLGMFDIDGFTPIINPPQAAILGVGRIAPKPVALDDEVKIRQMMTLSLSFDHRIVDGGPAARFLQRIKQLIERPFALVIPVGEEAVTSNQ